MLAADGTEVASGLRLTNDNTQARHVVRTSLGFGVTAEYQTSPGWPNRWRPE